MLHTIVCCYPLNCVCGLLDWIRPIIHNFELPLTQISRSRHYLTLNISETYEIETGASTPHKRWSKCPIGVIYGGYGGYPYPPLFGVGGTVQ